ncbi:MAG: peptide chain release factor 3, partial [Bacteroidota bacterium]
NVCPLSWPVGMGSSFQGVYSLFEQKLVLFDAHQKQEGDGNIEITDLSDSTLDTELGERAADTLREEVELAQGVYPEFDNDMYQAGMLSPVFFGSAINNFGVRELIDCFTQIAPEPQESKTEERVIHPLEKKFTGFVFKIHANMDPNHRNRLAFVKVCSGQFERNKNYLHIRLGKKMKFANPTAFMAQKKSLVEEAYPGDIVGLYDTGNFKIGDSLSEGEVLHFTGIPSFAPELFKYVDNGDPMKSKQLAKGLDQLMDEGVAQLFTNKFNGRKIIGTVGALQFEVIQYRLKHEYGATCIYQPLSLYKACWITSEDPQSMKEFRLRKAKSLAVDKHGAEVFLSTSAWDLNSTQELFPKIDFHFTSKA